MLSGRSARSSSPRAAGPLQGPARGRLRDWALFAVAALGPAVAVSVLGLRAISTAEAGAQREVTLSLAAAGQETSRRIEAAMTEAERSFGSLGGDADAVMRALGPGGIAPPFSEPVLLGRDGQLLVPAPPAPPASAEPAPAACKGYAAAITSSDPSKRAEVRRSLLAECSEARTPEGRWIWPEVALDGLGRGEASADALTAWIREHAGLLCETEREATRLDVAAAAALSPAQKDAASALLASGSRRDDVEDAIQRHGVAALRSRPDARGLVTWRSGPTRGVLHPLADGRLAGFFVDPGSLARAIDRGWLGLTDDVRAQIVTGRAGDGARQDRPPSVDVEIAPELWLHLVPADPRAVTRKAARSRIMLAGLGLGATALAFAFAALLFARMRAAKRSSELRTDFVSTVSHELRTPIASVRMLAELLDEGRTEPEEQKEIFEALAREARRLGETVDRLLGFSRMAAGRHAVTLAPGNVAEAVAPSIDTFEERHADLPRVERAIDATIDAPIDAGQIRLAVDNLLANAAKYAPEGGPYRVRVERERGGVSIAVTDRGPGVARRDQRRIFEPFERADDRLSRATEGSGIGLSLVRFAAEAHGGRAGVESEPGRGATFFLWIPGGEEIER